MKILVTGSSGFVGARLTERLKKEGFDFHAISRGNKIHDSNRRFIGTLEEQRFHHSYDSIIHLAAYLTAEHDTESTNKLVDANIRFGLEILSRDCLRPQGLFVDFGSFAELHYSNDKNINYLYSESKKAFELMALYFCKANSIAYTKVIPYTIYSESNQDTKILDLIIAALIAKDVVRLSSGRQILDFIHVDDVIDLLFKILNHSNHSDLHEKSFECGSGKGLSIRELARKAEAISGLKANIEWNESQDRPFDIYRAIGDLALTKEFFGWVPIRSIEDTIKLKVGRMIGIDDT
jgi:nucleoside-diphosphate-sugar epimerase